MKVKVPVLVKDPSVSQWKDTSRSENHTINSERHLLDGPVTARVAVVDFDPASGQVVPGARFIAPKNPTGVGR